MSSDEGTTHFRRKVDNAQTGTRRDNQNGLNVKHSSDPGSGPQPSSLNTNVASAAKFKGKALAGTHTVKPASRSGLAKQVKRKKEETSEESDSASEDSEDSSDHEEDRRSQVKRPRTDVGEAALKAAKKTPHASTERGKKPAVKPGAAPTGRAAAPTSGKVGAQGKAHAEGQSKALKTAAGKMRAVVFHETDSDDKEGKTVHVTGTDHGFSSPLRPGHRQLGLSKLGSKPSSAGDLSEHRHAAATPKSPGLHHEQQTKGAGTLKHAQKEQGDLRQSRRSTPGVTDVEDQKLEQVKIAAVSVSKAYIFLKQQCSVLDGMLDDLYQRPYDDKSSEVLHGEITDRLRFMGSPPMTQLTAFAERCTLLADTWSHMRQHNLTGSANDHKSDVQAAAQNQQQQQQQQEQLPSTQAAQEQQQQGLLRHEQDKLAQPSIPHPSPPATSPSPYNQHNTSQTTGQELEQAHAGTTKTSSRPSTPGIVVKSESDQGHQLNEESVAANGLVTVPEKLSTQSSSVVTVSGFESRGDKQRDCAVCLLASALTPPPQHPREPVQVAVEVEQQLHDRCQDQASQQQDIYSKCVHVLWGLLSGHQDTEQQFDGGGSTSGAQHTGRGSGGGSESALSHVLSHDLRSLLLDGDLPYEQLLQVVNQVATRS